MTRSGLDYLLPLGKRPHVLLQFLFPICLEIEEEVQGLVLPLLEGLCGDEDEGARVLNGSVFLEDLFALFWDEVPQQVLPHHLSHLFLGEELEFLDILAWELEDDTLSHLFEKGYTSLQLLLTGPGQFLVHAVGHFQGFVLQIFDKFLLEGAILPLQQYLLELVAEVIIGERDIEPREVLVALEGEDLLRLHEMQVPGESRSRPQKEERADDAPVGPLVYEAVQRGGQEGSVDEDLAGEGDGGWCAHREKQVSIVF
jgi:hypothetical protein